MINNLKTFAYKISTVFLLGVLGIASTNLACFAEAANNSICENPSRSVQDCDYQIYMSVHETTNLYASSSLSGIIQSQHPQITDKDKKTFGTNNFSQSTGDKKNDVIHRLSLLDDIGREDFKICAALLPQQKLKKWQIVKKDIAFVTHEYAKISSSEEPNFQINQKNCESFFDLIFGN